MPASNPDDAQEKWERKTRNAEDKWEANVQDPSRSVAEGLADFWTGDENNANEFRDTENTWETEVEAAIDNNSYADGVEGKGDKWRRAAERGARNSQ